MEAVPLAVMLMYWLLAGCSVQSSGDQAGSWSGKGVGRCFTHHTDPPDLTLQRWNTLTLLHCPPPPPQRPPGSSSKKQADLYGAPSPAVGPIRHAIVPTLIW